MLVSTTPQPESAVGRPMSSPSRNSLPPPTPSHPSGLSSLPHTANSHWLPTLHMVMHMFQRCSFNSFSTPSPFPIVSASQLSTVFISNAAQGSMYMSMPLSQFVPHSPSSSVSHVHSLRLHLYSCPTNRFISTLFLDLIHVHF